MSTKGQSIRVQGYSVFPGQIASNFVTAYYLQSRDESKNTRPQAKGTLKRQRLQNLPLISFLGMKIENKNQISTFKDNNLKQSRNKLEIMFSQTKLFESNG